MFRVGHTERRIRSEQLSNADDLAGRGRAGRYLADLRRRRDLRYRQLHPAYPGERHGELLRRGHVEGAELLGGHGHPRPHLETTTTARTAAASSWASSTATRVRWPPRPFRTSITTTFHPTVARRRLLSLRRAIFCSAPRPMRSPTDRTARRSHSGSWGRRVAPIGRISLRPRRAISARRSSRTTKATISPSTTTRISTSGCSSSATASGSATTARTTAPAASTTWPRRFRIPTRTARAIPLTTRMVSLRDRRRWWPPVTPGR